MAQKTNPISLRLQKTNKHFSSCWYSDYFYDEMSKHDFRIRSYVESVLDQIGHSCALLCVQNQYKKVDVYSFLLDARGIRYEKEQLLRLPRGRAKSPSLPIPLFLSPLSSNEKREKSHVCDHASDKYLSLCRSIYISSNKFYNNLFAGHADPFRNPFKVLGCTQVSLEPAYQAHVNLPQTHPASSRPTLTSSVGGRVDQLSSDSKESSSNLMEGCINNPVLDQPLFRQLIQETLFRGMQKHTSFQHKYWESLAGIDDGWGQLSSLNPPKIVFDNLTTIARPREMGLSFKKYHKTRPFQELMEMMLSIQSSLLATFHPIRVVRHIQNGQFLIGEIVYLLQKRVSFRQIKDQIIREAAESPIIKGIRLSCSGRLGGRSKKAQKSKTQSIQWGQTSLHVLSSKLSFASKGASTPFGKIGIKLWICYK